MSSIKERLAAGENVTGTMVSYIDSPDIIRIMQVIGYDYVIIDYEHGYMDLSRLAAMFALGRAHCMPTLIRLPEVRRELVLKVMEMGASGILLPNTETAAQARQLVEHAKYAPLGNRGISLLRCHNGYEKVDLASYSARCNCDTILMCQIESPTGVDNLDEILQVEGIDSVLVGPNDLSQSYGIYGQMEHPVFQEAIEKILAAANRNGKYAGIHLMDAGQLRGYMQRGMQLNLLSNDLNMMITAGKAGLAEVRQPVHTAAAEGAVQ